MVIDPDIERSLEAFPAELPTDGLRSDHRFVLQQFDRYLDMSLGAGEREEVGREILMMLDRHMAVEEGVFYPRVRELASELVDQCDAEHQEAMQLMEVIRGLEEGGEKIRSFRRLAQAIEAHVEREERELFPLVEKADIDLAELGMDMQAFEASMIAAEADTGLRAGARRS